jgi:hypothetical protein
LNKRWPTLIAGLRTADIAAPGQTPSEPPQWAKPSPAILKENSSE